MGAVPHKTFCFSSNVSVTSLFGRQRFLKWSLTSRLLLLPALIIRINQFLPCFPASLFPFSSERNGILRLVFDRQSG